jgi:hypothetical protein
MNEIWKQILGFDGFYFVSNLGRIKSFKILNTQNKNKIGIIKKQRNNKGYKIISVKFNKVKISLKVHRLVAMAFIPNPENKSQINHKDGNKSNNNVNNLEWATGSENVKHAFNTGLKEQYFGSEHYMSKCILQFDKSGIFLKKWDCMSDACRVYNIKLQSLSSCVSGKSKTCGGYKWQYKTA